MMYLGLLVLVGMLGVIGGFVAMICLSEGGAEFHFDFSRNSPYTYWRDRIQVSFPALDEEETDE